MYNLRIGQGYDVHRLVPERKLILGGVEISYSMGLLGHSDADVLTHSIIDALLGAADLGDIGSHFPDTDPQYENISSMILLEKVFDMLVEKNIMVLNVDSTIIAQEPKLSQYIPKIKANLYKILRCPVSVKATTEEGLGFTGKKEGISAIASILIHMN